MTPEALSVWIQRAGRAGRDGRLSRAILLVEPSVAKKVNKKTSKGQKRPKDITKGGILFTLSTRVSVADQFLPQITKSCLRPSPMSPMTALQILRKMTMMMVHRIFQ